LSPEIFRIVFSLFPLVLDVDLSSLFIVGNCLIEYSWIPTLTLKDKTPDPNPTRSYFEVTTGLLICYLLGPTFVWADLSV
jgi:hypothetical protein